MISTDILSVPSFTSRPVAVGSGPECIGGGKSKGQESGCAEIKTACVDIVFRHADLAASIAYTQPAVSIERSGLRKLSLNDSRQRTTHLGRADVMRQDVEQGGIGQGMERAKTVDDGAPRDRIAAFG